ncbi:MAG: glycosyltransferase family 2 protein [Patescibacteria group bacterium]|jgi:glycosyltransferase involved in cell wall biosynthesis|nr:glycosyltransferase family 2 protein [Patescibacteria group bacterium]
MEQIQSKIVVVIPAYNEAPVIQKTLNEVLKFISAKDILVIDDGSSDQTAELVQALGVKVVRHVINLGCGGAIKTGLDYAVKKMQADIVVTFDADGQHDASQIQSIIEPISNHQADLVIGSRFISENLDMPWYRVLANKIANLITFILFGAKITDSQSGLRAFSRESLQKLKLESNTFEFSSEIIIEARRNKLKIIEKPINVRYTDYSLSKGQGFFRAGPKTLYKLILKRILD